MKSATYYIYTLRDAAGEPLYVGRSSNVATRIRLHNRDAQHDQRKASWFYRARDVTMFGPFTYDVAARVEFERIQNLQPVGNIRHLEGLSA